MPAPHNPNHVALVCALRGAFTPMQLASINIQMVNQRRHQSSIADLANAVRDAADPLYNAGEDVHPAVRGWLAQRGRS